MTVLGVKRPSAFLVPFHTSNVPKHENFTVALLGFWRSRFESRPGDCNSL